MDVQVVVGLIGFAGVLASTVVAQSFLHRRWTREQDARRAEVIAANAAERKQEAAEQAQARRDEMREILERMERQNNAVVENAVQLAEVHSEDAEKARLLALEAAQAHTECRQEVSHLSGKVEELRARVVENERISGRELLISQRHQDLKHAALTALSVSEGITDLAVRLAKNCECHAFDPIAALTENYHPKLDELTAMNRMSIDEWLANHPKGTP